MDAFKILGIAGTVITVLLGLITLTEKGHAFWRYARDTVRFWWTLKKRVTELEAPQKPRTFDQQHCPVCAKRGSKVGPAKFYKGNWSTWFTCDDCKEVWPVKLD